MERGGVGNELHVKVRNVVREWNYGLVLDLDKLWIRSPEIWVPTIGVAITQIPARVDSKFHKISKSALLLGPERQSARECAELVQADGLMVVRDQKGVDELCVGSLVSGHIASVGDEFVLNVVQGAAILLIACGQLPILVPKIAFQELGCGKEPEDMYVTRRDSGCWGSMERKTGLRSLTICSSA